MNPYATPRIQRLVPERTADGMALLMEAGRRRQAAMLQPFVDAMGRVQLELVNRYARWLLQDYAAEDALVSGAMPGEFNAQELRYAD